MFWKGLIVGLFVGAFVGVVVISMLIISKETEEKA